ncbi:hypothetical protein PIB30_088909 [Stylosanthes scabra]|uniref:Uncharacterized protein n=1 Tax=Stylosanthes scabra TaxID=79078 RepID=A0ABU6UTZ8_9FABA|nr:hypothetical protein [Stylosanthes scabra]
MVVLSRLLSAIKIVWGWWFILPTEIIECGIFPRRLYRENPTDCYDFSLLRAYVTDWWFLNHIDNIALTDTIGKPYLVKRASDNVGFWTVNRRMSSWPALGTGMHHSCLPHFCVCASL